MKKIITSIILVGAFFVCAYTSESAETDKYAYIVLPVNEDKYGGDKVYGYMYRIDKKTDEIEVQKISKYHTKPTFYR
jgi:hypothetical protein